MVDIALPAEPRVADVLVARLERLPFSRKHWLVAAVLCTATFFDGYDNLMISSALPLILAALKVPLASGVCLAIGGATLLRFGPETKHRVLEEIAA